MCCAERRAGRRAAFHCTLTLPCAGWGAWNRKHTHPLIPHTTPPNNFFGETHPFVGDFPGVGKVGAGEGERHHEEEDVHDDHVREGVAVGLEEGAGEDARGGVGGLHEEGRDVGAEEGAVEEDDDGDEERHRDVVRAPLLFLHGGEARGSKGAKTRRQKMARTPQFRSANEFTKFGIGVKPNFVNSIADSEMEVESLLLGALGKDYGDGVFKYLL